MKILKFATPTCMPCRALGKILEGMNLDVENIDATVDEEKVEKFNVCTTPTLVFLNDEGKEVRRTTGLVSKSVLQGILDTFQET